MNTQNLEIAINQLERVHRDMNDCANRFILKDAIDQLQEQVKLFSIPDVVVPKGTFCPKCKSDDVAKRKNGATDTMCFDCGNIF